MRTYVYVDGFNLYYRLVKGTPYKWLNIRQLVETIVKGADVQQVRYFTARAESRKSDNYVAARQEVYFRALRTLPNFIIHDEGSFQTHPRMMPLANPPAVGPKFANVLRTEEKGSDVNLAAYLLLDGFRNDYEQAVVISNDSDLATPVRMVRDDLNLSVVVLCPEKGASKELRKSASAQRPIRQGVLRVCQFPTQIIASNGRTITKPTSW
jgi:uncharacterized LabA/DUF88 family protein